jgi:hypothetical protein
VFERNEGARQFFITNIFLRQDGCVTSRFDAFALDLTKALFHHGGQERRRGRETRA